MRSASQADGKEDQVISAEARQKHREQELHLLTVVAEGRKEGVAYPETIEAALHHLVKMPLDYSGAADAAGVTRAELLSWTKEYPERFVVIEQRLRDRLIALMILKATGGTLPEDAEEFKFSEAYRVMQILSVGVELVDSPGSEDKELTAKEEIREDSKLMSLLESHARKTFAVSAKEDEEKGVEDED